MGPSIELLVVDADDGVAAQTAGELERRNEPISAHIEPDLDVALDCLAERDCVIGPDGDGVDGLELLASVREHRPELPVVLCTATENESRASRAIEAGATDYLCVGPDRPQFEVLAARIRTAVERYRIGRDLERVRRRYESLVEQDLVGIYVVRDGRFDYANPRFADLFEYDRSVMTDDLEPLDLVAPEDRARVSDLVERLTSGDLESAQYDFTGLTRSGRRVEVEGHGSRVDTGDGPAVLGTLLGRPAAGRTDHELSAIEEVTAELLGLHDRAQICETAVAFAERSLGLPITGIHLVEGERALQPVAVTDGVRELVADPPPTYTPADGIVWEAYRTGETRVIRDTEFVDLETTMGSGVVSPIGRYGVLITSAATSRSFDHTEIRLAKLLAATVEAALDRADHERRLNRLHETTRELMSAPTVARVAEVATETAREVLGLTINGVYLLDETGHRLEPQATTDEATALFDGAVSFERGESLAWQVFEEGEARTYDDVREAPILDNPETEVRSELLLPLGDHGVFVAGSTVAAHFDEETVSLAKVLASNTEAALDRAEREASLRQREAELERQNRRLDEFASVVSHDLRNPLGVAQGRLELLREECGDSEHADDIEAAHSRIQTLIHDLLALARQGRMVGDTEPVALRHVVSDVWASISGGRLSVPDDLGTIDADPDRLRELLENLVQNAVRHGGTDATVTVDRLDDRTGFYVADDGPGVPPDERDRVFERGYTTDADGTGFGLAIVQAIAEAHGWEVRAVESASGGARFEIVTDDTDGLDG